MSIGHSTFVFPPNPILADHGYTVQPDANLDPALVQHSLHLPYPTQRLPSSQLPSTPSGPDTPPPITFPATQPLASATLSRRPQCITPRCARKAAKSCTTRRCKPCCEALPEGCPTHKGKRAVSTSSLPYKPARPLPSIPPSQPLLLSHDMQANREGAPSAVHPFEFSKPVPAEWEADWNQKKAKRDSRNQATQAKVENERMIWHQVSVWTWAQDGAQPFFTSVQGIKTWNTLNLAQLTDLPSLLGVGSVEGYQLFHDSSSTWLRGIDHALRAFTNQNILIRAPGVTDCPGLDERREASLKRPICPSVLAETPCKRPRLETVADAYQLLEVSSPSSPNLSHASSPISLPQRTSSATLLDGAAEPSDNDDEWAEGYVRVPKPGTAGKWPSGMYARDMAKGFELVSAREPTMTTLDTQFTKVFPGVPYVKATWYAQRALWKVNERQRNMAIKAPRTADGTWAQWRRLARS